MAKKPTKGKASTPKPKPAKVVQPTGVASIDALADSDAVTMTDYLRAVSDYIHASPSLGKDPMKAAQIRLSNGLARAMHDELIARIPRLEGNLRHGEAYVGGALRKVKADVSEAHPLDGTRLAVELKPINLSVGKAIWNRFGDIRAFAINIHLKFPFAVVGGVLVIPVYELAQRKPSKPKKVAETGSVAEAELEFGDAVDALSDATSADADAEGASSAGADLQGVVTISQRDTTHLIVRAVDRLKRAGGRMRESDAAHLLEGVAVVVYDPSTGALDSAIPPVGSGLRWDEFIDAIVASYEARFED